MDRKFVSKGLVLAFVAAGCWSAGDARAHSHLQKGLEIVHPWCFATGPAAAKTVAVYMLIKNHTKRPDRLIGATTPGVQRTELREPRAGFGEETRAMVGVPLKGRQEVALKRDGPHLILSGLGRPLAPYDSFAMTLIFRRAGKIQIEVMVEEGSAATSK